MSSFDLAFNFLMGFEDPEHLWENVPDNKGHVISGINSLAWPEDFAKIAAVAQSERGPYVEAFYDKRYWTPLSLGQLNQDIANRVLDMSVNAGSREGILCLQRAISVYGQIEVDGVIGPLTIAAANSCDQSQLLASYREQRAKYYRAVVANNPNDARYLETWLKRANS